MDKRKLLFCRSANLWDEDFWMNRISVRTSQNSLQKKEKVNSICLKHKAQPKSSPYRNSLWIPHGHPQTVTRRNSDSSHLKTRNSNPCYIFVMRSRENQLLFSKPKAATFLANKLNKSYKSRVKLRSKHFTEVEL